MAPPNPSVGPQTLRQAKAAYKARGQPTLTDREKRQLDRSAELDRRAWRIKEAEKRKAEVAKRRQETEQQERVERENMRRIGRKSDKFGFLGSQMHLGAWFGDRSGEGAENTLSAVDDRSPAANRGSEDEWVGDGGVDDQTLLSVLSVASETETYATIAHGDSAHQVTKQHTHSQAQIQRAGTRPGLLVENDFTNFLDELDSSTQIARELASDDDSKMVPAAASHQPPLTSDDFDLSVQDLEEIASSSGTHRTVEDDKTLMPPPALPMKRMQSAASSQDRLATTHNSIAELSNYGPSLPAHLGFNMAELEGFVDDDLQLMQSVFG